MGEGNSGQDLILKELQAMRFEQKMEHNEVMGKLACMESNNEAIKKRTEIVENKVDHLDKENRKRNIVIYGVPEKIGETYTNLQEITSSILNGKLECCLKKEEIDDLFRLGKNTGGTKPRPILIKFISFWRKKEILSKSSQLKGTNIFMANDLTPTESEKMKTLRSEMKDLKAKGHTVKIKGMKLIVDGASTMPNLEETGNYSRTGEENATMYFDVGPQENQVFQEVNNSENQLIDNRSSTGQKRQKSPETLTTIYKETNVEESLKKKKKLFEKSHIRASSLGQITLDSVGIQLGLNKNLKSPEKKNINYQHIIHKTPDKNTNENEDQQNQNKD